jgi:uncharacterized protein YndB with AHSA1/START domain
MMTKSRTANTTFTLERVYDATPARVFAAWADPAAKAAWFIGPGGWKEHARSNDFVVGGTERLTGVLEDGTRTTFVGHYHDIVLNERIVYAYDVLFNDERLSVSLVTVELEPVTAGTRLLFTEHLVCLDGYEDPGAQSRISGTEAHLDRLGKYVQQ